VQGGYVVLQGEYVVLLGEYVVLLAAGFIASGFRSNVLC
jgi:hypothetical protein